MKETGITKFKHSKLQILESILMYVGFLAIMSAIIINLICN